MAMQTITTTEQEMVVMTKSEYMAIEQKLESEVQKRIRQRERNNGIPHTYYHRVIRGENPIKVYREWRGLSQYKLANILGVSQGNIGKMERWANIGSTRMLLKIATALNIDFKHLAQYQCEGYDLIHHKKII